MSDGLLRYSSASASMPPIPPEAVCAGCGTAETLVRDHCHEHGWVRGVVCRSCNFKLGHIDQGFMPRAPGETVTALLAVHNSCPDCEQVDGTRLVRFRVPDPELEAAIGQHVRAGVPGACYLSQQDIAGLLGLSRSTVNVWRSRYRDFPEPDVRVGLGSRAIPGWLPRRMDEIRAWSAARKLM